MKMKKAVRMPLRRSPQRPRPAAAPLRARAAAVDEEYEDDEDYGGEEEPNMKFSHALFVVLVLHIIAVGGVLAFNWMKTRQAAESAVAAAPAAEKTVEPMPAPKAEAKPAPVAKSPALDGWTGKTHTIQAGDTLTHIAATYKTTVVAIERENEITSLSTLRVGQVVKIPGTEKTTKSTEAAKSESATKEAFLAAKSETAKPATGTISAVPRGTETASTKPAEAKPAEAKPAEAKAPAASASGDVYVVAKGDNPYTIAKKHHVSYNKLLEINGIKDATKVQIGQKLKIPKQ